MPKYIVRRILKALPVLIITVVFSFFIIHLMPGDPVTTMLGDKATQGQILRMQEELNLDKPIIDQFLIWIKGVFTLNMGESLLWKQPVTEIIAERIEPTFLLALLSTGISILIGIPVGVKAARARGGYFDKIFSIGSLVSISLPAFWIAIIFIQMFSVNLGIFPTSGYRSIESSGIIISIYDLLLPAMVLGIMHSGQIARMTRATMIDVLDKDYLRTARAKGLSEKRVINRHALINALPSIIIVIGFSFATLLGGAAVIEQIFNIPGTGNLAITAVLNRDYPLIQGVLLFIAIVFISINMMVDIICALINPRNRFE